MDMVAGKISVITMFFGVFVEDGKWKKMRINEKNIRNNIAELKEKGFLERIGPDKGGHWKVHSAK